MVFSLSTRTRFGEAYPGTFTGVSPARMTAMLMFTATCLQVAFLKPYVVIVPGTRSNLFSGVMCAASLLAAWLASGRRSADIRSGEFIISLILSVMMIMSCLMGSTPGSSSARAFVILASSLGGFWCARILLDTESNQRFFRDLCILILVGMLAVAFVSFHQNGEPYRLLDSNPHPMADRLLLLWFAPLSMLFSPFGAGWIVCIFLLAASYVVFYLSMLRSAMLIPPLMAVLAALLKSLRWRYVVAALIPVAVVLAFFFYHLPAAKLGKEYEPAYYRAENYPFSLHIALKHPILGIGLRAPRDEYLEDYEIKYPYVTREQFSASVRRISTSENIFLTFMTELGFPFALIYIAALVVLLRRLVRQLRTSSPPSYFHPLALFLPLVGAVVHFQFLDGLFHPQLCWFFHVLLGLIPSSSGPEKVKGIGLADKDT